MWVERDTWVQLVVMDVMSFIAVFSKKNKYRCKTTLACVCPSAPPPGTRDDFGDLVGSDGSPRPILSDFLIRAMNTIFAG